MQGDHGRIRLFVANTGKTPATNVRFLRQEPMLLRDGAELEPPEPSESDWEASDLEHMVVPGTENRFQDVQFRLNRQVRYVSGTHALFVWVRMEYCDVAHRPRWTQAGVMHRYGEPFTATGRDGRTREPTIRDGDGAIPRPAASPHQKLVVFTEHRDTLPARLPRRLLHRGDRLRTGCREAPPARRADVLQRGDRPIVSELSRLGRSLGRIVAILDPLAKAGVAFVAPKENIRVEGRNRTEHADRPLARRDGAKLPPARRADANGGAEVRPDRSTARHARESDHPLRGTRGVSRTSR